MWASPPYWGCPKCGTGEAWILCDGRIMCTDDDCYAIFDDLAAWVAGRQHSDSADVRSAGLKVL